MRFAGIDIASETHVVAVVDEASSVTVKPASFSEDAAGYQKLFGLLGAPGDLLVAMEATGHYWQNLFAALAAAGFTVALLNPLRTHRFAGEDLQRTKTDAIDAVGIARFAAQKRPAATPVPDALTEELLGRVNARGRVYLSSTRLSGQYVIRLCVLSFRTHLDRVRDAIEGLQAEADVVLGAGSATR